MLFKDLSEEIIKESIRNLRNEQIQGEIKQREKLKDFYEDRQGTDGYLYSYGFKNKAGKAIIPLGTYNITKKIIDKRSLLYKKPPQRTIEDKDDYEVWISDHNSSFNYVLKTAERYKNLLRRVLFRPVYDMNSGKWNQYIETSYEPHFVEGNPLVPVAYSIPIKQNIYDTVDNQDDLWVFLSKDLYFFHDNNGNIKYDDNYPTGENPYGIIPLVELMGDLPVDEYGGGGAISLVNSNQAINIAMADINLMLHYQAFDQAYVTGIREGDEEKIEVGPNKVIGLPEGSTAGLLGYSPKIIESIEAIKFQIHSIAWAYDVSIDWSIEGTVASGVALKIKNMDLLEAREDDIDLAKEQEKQIYKVIQAIQRYHKPKGEKLLPDGNLMVNFTEVDFPANVDEEIKTKEFKLKHNIITPIDLMKQDDPDLNDDTAMEKFTKNKEINGKLTRADKFKAVADNEPAINTTK